MSRRCPRCKNVYAGEARFCPKDGSPLVDLEGQEVATAPPSDELAQGGRVPG
jgi:uncharacterized OB-fold protein